MSSEDLELVSAVPANRLGQLLAEARLANGADLEDLAVRSEFTVGELGDLEAGHRLLDDDLIKRVTTLYEIDCGPIIPQRSGLVIDLDDQLMTAASHALPLDSTARDHVLDRYLSLVYLLRNNTPGTKVTLREEDMDILAASLAERRELIEEQLLLAMDPSHDPVTGLFGWFRQRLWVPAAGALVGATSVGVLVMLSSTSTAGEFIPAEQLLADAGVNPDLQPNSPAAGLIVPGSASNTSASSSTASTTGSSAAQTSTASTATDAPTTITRPASVVEAQSIETTAASRSIGAQAEELLPFDWQAALPGWQINYRGHNTQYRGLTYPYDRTIEIFVRESDTPERLATILAHELGHAIDVEYLTAEQRDSWLDVRNIENAPWWADAYASDFQSGAGDFAEAFAVWAVNDQSSSEIAGQPTPAQIQHLVAMLDAIL